MNSSLHALAHQLSPGVDPTDVDLVVQAWRHDQPDTLAEVLVFAELVDETPALVDDSSPPGLAAATALVHQARYGNPAQLPADQVASWRDLGYTTEPADGGGWPVITVDRPASIALSQARDAYDVVVVGSGCGAIAARIAAESGANVLLVEAGDWLPPGPPDALRNQRVGTGLETPAGPPLTGRPRVAGSPPHPVDASHHLWGNNAFTLGGGTRVYGAQAWRFSDLDFRMATTYGVPEGSSLADWPIDLDELAPYYLQAEHDLGVSGDRSDDPSAHGAAPYPMPPTVMNHSGLLLARGAENLGWATGRVPLAVNSQTFQGRSPCRSCGACVGFTCRAEAKNDTRNTALPRALATGRCDLLLGTRATRVRVAPGGSAKQRRATGVDLVDAATGARRHVRAGRVVLAAGAVETARLLLLSAHEGDPDGLGNGTDQVGRHLQAHLYPGAVGVFDDIVQDGVGPGPTVAVTQFRHGNPGIVGGGMLANDFVPLPQYTVGVLTRAGLLPSHGAAVHEQVSHLYRRHVMVFGPVQEVPTARSRVRLDDNVTDHLGLPVARLEGSVHPEDLRTSEFMMHRAVEWLEAAGAAVVRPLPVDPRGPSVGQHQAGTCRMGDDPATSVVDPFGRVWGHSNLYLADTSVHVTNGGVNPVLTALALATRTATAMLSS